MRRIIVAVIALAAAAGSAVVSPLPAQAAARVSITSSDGAARASATGPTTLKIKGTGFQSLKGGFGGIYLMFGWVDDPSGGSWRPSRGGKTGADLLYVPDSESKSNHGYQRFIAFPGSSTEGSANGGEVSAAGSFALSLVVPGPTFTAQDRSGASTSVDCLKVTCGIITIGAHGVANASNETFTPISFGKAAPTTVTTGESSAAPSASPTAGATPTAGSPTPAAPATLGLTQTTVQAGRVLGFTGQGFVPGEQVVVTVGAGLAGVGPLTAGQFGEVAGALLLPADMRAGSHVVSVKAAGSGRNADVTVSVMAAAPAAASAQPAAAEPGSSWWTYAAVAVATLAGVLLILIVASLITAIVRRRRASASAKNPGGERT